MALFFFSTISVSAKTQEYKNVIDDSTTIENDITTIGLSYEDYHIHHIDFFDFSTNDQYNKTVENWDKFFIVGMSERLLENKQIQTYFYVFNPIYHSLDNQDEHYLRNIEFNYSINQNPSYKTDSFEFLMQDNGIFKFKGFIYDYSDSATISIRSIHSYCNFCKDKTFNTDFVAEVKHEYNDGNLSIALKYDSDLIIEEYKVVEDQVGPDNNLINNWNEFWERKQTNMLVYFYNFNFPKHLLPDSIEYAKFEYNLLKYHEVNYISGFKGGFGTYENEGKTLIKNEKIISEYNNESRKLQVNGHSQVLNFPTFYIGGNRYEDGQFGDLKLTNKEDFDYDISILLDSTFEQTQSISGQLLGTSATVGTVKDYTIMDNVNFIELHWTKDGVSYHSRIITPEVGNDEFDHGVASDPTFSVMTSSKANQKFIIVVIIILIVLVLLILYYKKKIQKK